MVNALIGKKLGMSRVFSSEGEVTPVTVLLVGPCTITQIKTAARDGYNALQLGFGSRKPKSTTKAVLGHVKKSGKGPFTCLREVKVAEVKEFELGQELGADVFQVGEIIHVTGTSKGKGFAGTVKRWKFSRGPMSHGSMNKRPPGSIGSSAWPSRVVPGKKLPGHMGDRRVTMKNLRVVDVRPDQNVILVQGAVPGGRNGILMIRRSGRF